MLPSSAVTALVHARLHFLAQLFNVVLYWLQAVLLAPVSLVKLLCWSLTFCAADKEARKALCPRVSDIRKGLLVHAHHITFLHCHTLRCHMSCAISDTGQKWLAGAAVSRAWHSCRLWQPRDTQTAFAGKAEHDTFP